MILASKSPRRKEILEKIGFNLIIKTKEIEEISYKESIVDKIKEIAYKKAISIASENRDEFVVSADTVVVIDNQILGKPKDIIEAKNMLKKLSGREHTVITAYSLLNLDKEIEIVDSVISKVKFKDISENEMEWYLKNEIFLDKAGAYGIQGKASIFIEGIVGDYFSIMGFPINSFLKSLNKIGIDIDKIKNM